MIYGNNKWLCSIDCLNGKQKQVKSMFEGLLSSSLHIAPRTLLRCCNLSIYDKNVQDLSK